MKKFGSWTELEDLAFRENGFETTLSPTAGSTGSYTLSLPALTGSDTIVGQTSSSTLQNKDLDDDTTRFLNTGFPAKLARFLVDDSQADGVTLLTLPDVSGRIVSVNNVVSLLNKTIDFDTGTTGNSVANVPISGLEDGTADSLIIRDGLGATTESTTLPVGLAIDSDVNPVSNIDNADIKAAAAIAVDKLAAVTASKALASDGSGFITAATTTAAELDFLSGVTSAVQTQIDSKQADVITTQGDLVVGDGFGDASRLALGGSGTVLSSNGTTTVWTTPAGTGDVTAAAVMADNALVRGDGGVKGVQDSGILISDTDDITGVNDLTVGNDLTVDTNSLIVDGTTSKVRVGSTDTALSAKLQVLGTATADGQLAIGSDNIAANQLYISAGSGSATLTAGSLDTAISIDQTTANVTIPKELTVIQDLTVGTNSLFVDVSAGDVGIGTVTPGGTLHIQNGSTGGTPSAGADELVLENSTASTGIQFLTSDTDAVNLFFGTSANSARGYIQYNHDGDYMRFSANGGEKVRLTSAGRLGIGTDVPDGMVHVYAGSSGGTAPATADDLIVENSGSGGIQLLNGTTSDSNIFFGDSGTPTAGYIQYDHAGDYLRFGANAVERMRIASDGKVLIGTTVSDANNSVSVESNSLGALGVYRAGGGSTGAAVFTVFSDVTSVRAVKAYIQRDGAFYNNGVFGTVSDASIKENISPARNYLSDLNLIPIKKYSWIGEEKTEADQLGVIAQDVEAVFPTMVTLNEDGIKSVKMSIFIPMLITAVQELSARVAALEAV